ncbi:hypothetical protein [Kocuria sp. CPCC 205231]|uniref:ParB family protein n=1 Tax=Kocuria sp. CPCC 205231 TaxID=3073551 RepID=UPI0034D3AAC7
MTVQSDFIDNAVMAEVQRLEAKYNGGQPFPRAAPWGADAHTDSGRQDDRYPALGRGSDRIGSVAAHRLPVRHHMTGALIGLWL